MRLDVPFGGCRGAWREGSGRMAQRRSVIRRSAMKNARKARGSMGSCFGDRTGWLMVDGG